MTTQCVSIGNASGNSVRRLTEGNVTVSWILVSEPVVLLSPPGPLPRALERTHTSAPLRRRGSTAGGHGVVSCLGPEQKRIS